MADICLPPWLLALIVSAVAVGHAVHAMATAISARESTNETE